MNPAGKFALTRTLTPAGQTPAGAVGIRAVVAPLRRETRSRAFSLFEMVIVVGLMGLLAALALPSMKLGKGSQMSAATRQLLDDLTLARLRAINNRSEVYVVFLPQVQSYLAVGGAGPAYDFFTANQAANHLLGAQTAAYAIYSKRTLGDQPGRPNSRYMSEWKTLPDGVFIGYSTVPPVSPAGPPGVPGVLALFDTAVFFNTAINQARPMEGIMFPDTTTGIPLPLPYIVFDEKGALRDRTADVRIPLATGSLLATRTATGSFSVVDIDALETPQFNSVSNRNVLVINYQTGRARVDRPTLELP